MFALIITCLLAAAMPQAQPQASPAAAPSRPAPIANATPAASAPLAAEVPPTQAVITIHGLCPAAAVSTSKSRKASASAAACTTVMTRGQLDKLISVLNTQNQPITPQIRRQFAQNYAELLIYGQAAKKSGTEDADFAELMRFVRLSTLVRLYRSRLEEQYRKIPDAEIASYYTKNSSKYEEISL